MKELFNLILLVTLTITSCIAKENTKPTNVLFIAIDDLRPELGCYGASHIKSPHIDALAKQSLVFNKAYCNIPVCGASRASLMTGVRPSWKRFVGFSAWADKDLPGNLSLAQHFKNNGYHTVSLGKIYHQENDDSNGWSEPEWRPKTKGMTRDYILQSSFDEINHSKKTIKKTNGPAFEAAEGHDTIYNDGRTTVQALSKMEELAKGDKPFFLAVGYYKPHLPFNAPKKYWDMYDPAQIELADNPFIPENAPKQAIHTSAELRKQYSSVPESTPLPDEYATKLRHGYYACVSYIDAQIGMLLGKLKELGLDENTVVVLWGDHGWNLGEHTMWCKHNLFITSLRAPLIIKAPGKTKGKSTDALSEFVDIYPTVSELCGLEIPEHCEGASLVPLIKKPKSQVKEVTYSKWHSGFCMRTEQYQYSEWLNPKTNEPVARMLYDHKADPDENVNIAELPENEALVTQLSEQLHNWWKDYVEQDILNNPQPIRKKK